MKTLHGKFFLVIATLVLAIGGLAFILQMATSRHYTLAMTQVLNRTVAEHLVEQYFPAISSNPEDIREIKTQFSRIMAINPNIELYIVDGDGRIKAFTAPADQVRRGRIDLQPAKNFISHRFAVPILGDDPMDPTGKKIFSAAPLRPDQPEAAFLYVILGGADYDIAALAVQPTAVFHSALIMILSGVLIALVAAFFVSTTMTLKAAFARRCH